MDRQLPARTVQRRARGVQRIASILTAAETVFAEVGYDEANTNRIAAQAGISPGTLYHFFSKKEEIAQALVDHYTKELQRMYRSIFSYEAASVPLSIWLDRLIDSLLAFQGDSRLFLDLFEDAHRAWNKQRKRKKLGRPGKS
jgi:AcrR family transcriptional regulator